MTVLASEVYQPLICPNSSSALLDACLSLVGGLHFTSHTKGLYRGNKQVLPTCQAPHQR